MAKLTDILSDITQNEMSKKLMRMTEAEINAIPSHALTESLSRLEEFAGRSAPRKRDEYTPEELASINQARANAGLPLIKPQAPAPTPNPALVQRKSASDIETQAALAAAKAELDAQKTKPKVATQKGVKPLPSQDAVANMWQDDDAGVDVPLDTRSMATRKPRASADDEQDIYAPTDADDSRSRLGLDEREASDSNLQKLATLRKLIQRIAAKKAAEKFAQTPVVKEGGNAENKKKKNAHTEKAGNFDRQYDTASDNLAWGRKDQKYIHADDKLPSRKMKKAQDKNALATAKKEMDDYDSLEFAKRRDAKIAKKKATMSEGGQNYKDKRYDDDDKVPSNNEPMKIPKKLGRKGDGLGCRDHVNCRHNHKADDGEHPRTKANRKAVRKAVQQHPRNMEEGKLSRIAAGLGLAGAAMAGGAKTAGAQQATTVPNDSVQTVTGRDPGIAARQANMNLTGRKIDSQGARIRQTPNQDGTWTVTVDARKQPAATAPRTNEGGNAENKKKKNDAVADTALSARVKKETGKPIQYTYTQMRGSGAKSMGMNYKGDMVDGRRTSLASEGNAENKEKKNAHVLSKGTSFHRDNAKRNDKLASDFTSYGSGYEELAKRAKERTERWKARAENPTVGDVRRGRRMLRKGTK